MLSASLVAALGQEQVWSPEPPSYSVKELAGDLRIPWVVPSATGVWKWIAHPEAVLSPKPRITHGKNRLTDGLVTINENISLTKDQHQALKIVCDIYQQSFSEYIQEALVQTMRSDIEDG